MHNKIWLPAAALGLVLTGPAFAQTTAPAAAPMDSSMPMTHGTMPMTHNPVSTNASNSSPANVHAVIAPALPTPSVGPNATPEQLLAAAHMALQHHRTGAAQEALERAETRMLDRSTEPSNAGKPDMEPMIAKAAQAREALGKRDWAQADQLIMEMMKMPMASGSDMNGGAMQPAAMGTSAPSSDMPTTMPPGTGKPAGATQP